METSTPSLPATDSIDGLSLNITTDRLNKLRELFPEVFTEGKIDFATLKTVLGESVLNRPDRYGLSWAGKHDSFREIQKQTTCTLIPERDRSIDFDTTGNVFIEGENLEVLRVLQKSYYGRVKMIYIDPPYNTGNDHFIYPDDFSERLEDYQKRAGIKDEEGYLNKQDLWRKNTRENGQFHSVWLSMMYPRLFLARNLLRDDGVIFVSIDDTEVGNLRLLMDEVFGEEMFLACFVWHRRQKPDSRNEDRASTDHEYVLAYRKAEGHLRGKDIDMSKFKNPDNDPRGPWYSADLTGLASQSERPNLHYDVVNPATGLAYPPSQSKGWAVGRERFQSYIEDDLILWPSKSDGRPRLKKFLSHTSTFQTGFSTVLKVGFTTEGTRQVNELFGDKVFPFPKPLSLLQTLIDQGAGEDGIILDFFAGSGTTAQAVLELNKEDGGNRKFICIQMPEETEEKSEARKAGYATIADISRARIRKVIEKLNEGEEGKLELETPGDRGFRSYTLAPSNFKTWRALLDGGNVDNLLLEFRDAHKAEAEAANMVTELLLKAGLPLTTPVESFTLGATTAYNVDNGKLAIILEKMDDAVRDWIISTAPQHVVCLDTVFADNDQLLTNLKLQLTEVGIELTVI